jgi:hypothetical protein
LCLFLPFALLPTVTYSFATLPTEHCHITLRVANSGDRLELLRKDGAAIEERWPEVVNEQMDSSCLLVFGHEISFMVASLCYTGCEHSIGFPSVDILPLGVA